MAGLKEISTVWTNIKEVDLKPIRDSATRPVRIILVGEPGAGKHTLAEQMRCDPARPGVHSQSPIALFTFDGCTEPPVAHLIIVLIEATRTSFQNEQALIKKWGEAGKNVLVVINKFDLVENGRAEALNQGWQANEVLVGSVKDLSFLQHVFTKTVLELLPLQHLALGRQFPLFRLPIARQLINDTCFSNAAYSLSTGVAQIVPVLDLPLTVTDMIVLTKSQAFLAYKLGLLFGFSTRWQDYVKEFGGVIGSGFVWRQIARQLVGLVPVWGIIPKVAISYSGTYVVGHAILGWYLTGRHLTAKQMRTLSSQAFAKGKDYARKLGGRLRKTRPDKGKKRRLPAAQVNPELTQGNKVIIEDGGRLKESIQVSPKEVVVGENESQVLEEKKLIIKQRRFLLKERRANIKQITKRKKEESPGSIDYRSCGKCGKNSSLDASFCQYCGNPLE